MTGIAVMASARADAEGDAGAATTWKDVEQSEDFKTVSTKLKAGTFDDAARELLEKKLLPLLEQDANRPSLDDVRKKIRDRFLLMAGNDKDIDEANTIVLTKMKAVAANETADPIVRTQAMLFVGDLVDKARIPWTPAAEVLAATAQDRSLASGVRVAAMVGLVSHVNAAARLSADRAETVRKVFAKTVMALLEPAAEQKPDRPRPLDETWMASRGLGLLPLASNPVTPEMSGRLVTMIDDRSWPIDVRVRAAVALGRAVGPESAVKGPEAVAAIKNVAIAALEADRAEADRILDLREYRAGGGQPGPQPAGMAPMGGMAPMAGMDTLRSAEDGFSPLACRRMAWRLHALGDAIDGKGRKGTLAALCEGKEGDDARKLSALLKQSGERLNAEPFGYVFFEIFDDIDPAGAQKRANELTRRPVEESEPEPNAPGENGQPAEPADEKPGPKPGPKPGDDPFGDSPFGK